MGEQRDFFAVPFSLWLFGPLWMLMGPIALTIILYKLDRTAWFKNEKTMFVESFIETYGYMAILVGTFLEGETILVLGGFAAHRGYLALPGVILAAFWGSLCGDQLFFFLGRWHSEKILARRLAWKARIAGAERLLDRHSTILILVFREK